MTPLRTLLTLASLVLLALVAAPNAVATSPIAQQVLDCYSFASDADHDGHSETWNACSTPTCGCMCPYVGAGIMVEAAGQERGAAVVTSGCQTAYATTSGPADGGAPVTVWPISGGGVVQG
jgi:hypothetical protein